MAGVASPAIIAGASSMRRWRVSTMILRGESNFPGEIRRAHSRVVDAALGAGVAVEEILPRELVDIGGAELLGALGLEVEEADHALLHRPVRVREEHVRNRRGDVQMLGRRQVSQEHEHEQRVHRPEGALEDVAVAGDAFANQPAIAWLAKFCETTEYGSVTMSKAFARNIVTMRPPIMLR